MIFERTDLVAGHLFPGDAWLDWAEWVSDCLDTMGFVNLYRDEPWSSASAPAGANTDTNYEIWRFNDSRQGTSPIFFRLDYGSATNTEAGTGSARITVRLANAWNGTNNITGVQVTDPFFWLFEDSAPTQADATMRIAGDAAQGRFSFVYLAGGVSNLLARSGAGCVERTRGPGGALNDDGAHLIVYGGGTVSATSSAHRFLYWPATGGIPNPTLHAPLILGTNGQNQVGNLVGVSPFPTFRGVMMPPPISFLATDNATGAVDGTLDIPMYGVTHEYRQMSATFANTSGNALHGSNASHGVNTRDWMINE